MPKTRFVDPDGLDQGIEVHYSKKHREITISGWYDSIYQIEPTCIRLEDFLRELGITKKDLPPWAE